MSAHEVFPQGVPHQFSFECTYRNRETSLNPWYMFYLSNSFEESQMYVKMNPSANTLEISLPQVNGDLQIIEFEHDNFFDENWHKIMIAVSHERASLWVDCQPVSYIHGSFEAHLEARGFFDTAGGHISIARFAEESVLLAGSAEIDLQWMVLSCDSSKPSRDSCDELPVS